MALALLSLAAVMRSHALAAILLAPLVACLAACSSPTFGPSPDSGIPSTAPSSFTSPHGDAGSTASADPDGGAQDGADADPPPEGTGLEGNGDNTGVVDAGSDAPILPGREPIGSLRKEIAVAVVGTAGDFVVGSAFATRNSASPDPAYTSTIVQVRNGGARTRCYVGATNYQLLDTQSRVLASTPETFLSGSVRASSPQSCLGPGEVGYFLGLAQAPYGSVAQVTFALNPGNIDIGVPQARMELESVASSPDPQASTVRFTFRNVGTKAAVVDTLSGKAALFDEVGPVDWELLFDCGNGVSATVLPGQALPLCLTTLSAARVTRTQAWCKFQDAP